VETWQAAHDALAKAQTEFPLDWSSRKKMFDDLFGTIVSIVFLLLFLDQINRIIRSIFACGEEFFGRRPLSE
jgi:hypothetical protein